MERNRNGSTAAAGTRVLCWAISEKSGEKADNRSFVLLSEGTVKKKVGFLQKRNELIII